MSDLESDCFTNDARVKCPCGTTAPLHPAWCQPVGDLLRRVAALERAGAPLAPVEEGLDSDPQIAAARRFDAAERLAEAYDAWKRESAVPATRCAVLHGPEGCPEEKERESREAHARRALEEAHAAYQALRPREGA